MTVQIVIFTLLAVSTNSVFSQTQSVSLCPLYLALQNRCPTQSTTLGPSTSTTTVSFGNETDYSAEESDVVDSCDMPLITFCPAMQAFLSGDRNCTAGQTIKISLIRLARLLISPSTDRAARMVSARYVDALGNTFTSISKTIQANPTQESATIGVTFIPVGQIIG